MAQSSLITASRRRNLFRALEQINDAFDTATGHLHNGTDSRSVTASVTLDQAYDSGGAGAGRAVTVDSGAVTLTNNAANNNNVLEITKSPAGAQSGAGLSVTMGANASGAAIALANSGSGADILGTTSTWQVSAAGVFTGAAVSLGTNPASAGPVRIANAAWVAARNAANNADVNIIRVNASNQVNLAVATVFDLAVTISAGGIAVTGNSTITGDLTVTGSLTFGGNWTVGATLTVDELILDTDGVQPAGTNNYWVRDNAGDLTGNAITGKQIILAINNVDEFLFSATVADFNDNALDNCGYLILNAATAPAGTEVYAVNDNTGDLTVNALTGKTFNVAVAGTDEYVFSATVFQLASANNIQFLGDNGILDSNANEVIEVSATAAATNGLLVKNAATGNPVIVSAQGTGATADRGIQFNDSNGNEALVLGSVATAVNELKVTNAVTTANPILEATGGDANVGINLLAKGTGAITLNNGTDPVILQLLGAQAGYNNEIQAVNGNEILALQGVATAVNELGITNAVTTANPAIIAQGGDANISITDTPKAAGQLNVAPGTVCTGAAPDIVIGGDIDSGIFGGTNIVAIATAGVERLRASAVGNIHIGNSTAAATAGDHAIYLTNATVNPSGLITNGVALYCTAGEFYALDAAGNATLNSPHSADGDYIIYSYSARKNQTVVIHLEKMLRALAARFPAEMAALMDESPGLVHKGDRVARGLAAV